MIKKHLIKSILLIFIIAGCAPTKNNIVSKTPTFDAVGAAKIFTAAYQQKAAEYRALCYQAYNIAHLRLDQFLQNKYDKPLAVMTDIDETVLDNSPYQVHQSLQGKDYDPVTWLEWTSKAEADTVPGAVGFFQYAASKGVEVFYVTNREERERESTLKNLKKYNFPFADNAHLKLKTTTSSKVSRRDSIAASYSLIMFFGDNLNDMNGAFEKKLPDERFKITNDFASDFGKKYIMIPNPSYGDWENALYHYNFSLTPQQKDSIFRAVLRNY